MPVHVLTPEQREHYGRYAVAPTPEELTHFFHLNDDDLAQIRNCRGEYNRLWFALQLTTVRYLGTFLDDPLAVPSSVVQMLARQLGISNLDSLPNYRTGKQRWEHVAQIRDHFGYGDITEPLVGFRLTRWLYVLCWSGSERPSVLFDRATTWLLAHKILLPGCSTLERFVVRLRSRVEIRVWRLLGRAAASSQQQARLEQLLTVPEGSRSSGLDKLRSGPTRVSGPSLRAAIDRLKSVRELGITLPSARRIPESRIALLARFANRAKVSLITRMPPARRLATLVAFVYCLEGTAQDDVLEVLESLLRELFGEAERADQKARLRTLKDLDEATTTIPHNGTKIKRLPLYFSAVFALLLPAYFLTRPTSKSNRDAAIPFRVRGEESRRSSSRRSPHRVSWSDATHRSGAGSTGLRLRRGQPVHVESDCRPAI
jgi:hypothetical protein